MFKSFNHENEKLPSNLEGLEFDELIEHGNQLLSSGKIKEAINCYQFAYSNLDNKLYEPLVLFNIAYGHVSLSEFEDGRKYCKLALDAITRTMKDIPFNIEHPEKAKIEALVDFINKNQPIGNIKYESQKYKEKSKDSVSTSDELVWKYGNRGLVKIKLEGEKDFIYGHIRGRIRSLTDNSIKYEFNQLLDFSENEELDDDDWYNIDFRYVYLDQIHSISNLKQPSFKELRVERFNAIMERVEDSFHGNFNFEISPQGNVLFLISDYIDSPITAINTINIMLQDNDDWEVFNAMNFDLVVFKGEEIFKLTNDQVHGVYMRR